MKKAVIPVLIIAVALFGFAIAYSTGVAKKAAKNGDDVITGGDSELVSTDDETAEDADAADTADTADGSSDDTGTVVDSGEWVNPADVSTGEITVDENVTEQEIPDDGEVDNSLDEDFAGASYGINADSSEFTLYHGDGFDRYCITSYDDPSVFLEIRWLYSTEAADAAPRFLSAYTDFTDIEFSGESDVGFNHASETIKAFSGDYVLDAYLINVEDGCVAATLCYITDEQQQELYSVLETLQLNG